MLVAGSGHTGVQAHPCSMPGEVGHLMVYLASDESSFSTGSEFIIDGGQTAGAIMWGFEDEHASVTPRLR